MNKAFIFDWSGTLSDNFHCFCQVCDLMSKEFNKEPVTRQIIKSTFTLPYMKFWNTHFPDLSKEEQNRLYNKFIHQVGEAELYDNVKNTIESIHHLGWQTFVLSSDPISKLLPETEKAGLANIFQKVVGDIHEKSYAIEELVRDFELDRDSTFYVGDSSGDVEAGKYARVKTIGISWGFQLKENLAKSAPDFLIDDIIDIIDIAKNI